MLNSNMPKQPWLHSAALDSLLVCGPAFLSVLGVFLFQTRLLAANESSLVLWVAFVLCCDVAHVYATLFRTYAHPVERARRHLLLVSAPLFALALGVLLYSISALLFWRVLAYVAVFHFIRQQYGFVRLYSRADSDRARRFRWIDEWVVYFAALYPIIFWHTHLPRAFHWFIADDFIVGLPLWLDKLTATLYVVCGLVFLVKELWLRLQGERINVPKWLVITGTAASWYTGIVLFNGDAIFTITNVMAHGIPYMTLVWIYGRREQQCEPERFRIFSPRYVPIYLLLLFGLAYLEEWHWHGLVWREYLDFFALSALLPAVTSHGALSILVPLLSLPQTTHYILDGFIWKRKAAT